MAMSVPSKSIAVLTGGAMLCALLSACASLQQPRQWGTCAAVGALLGAGAGAGIGIAINQNTSDHENNILAGIGGGVGGGALGALAGHYLCDPIITPPPPVVAEAPPPPPSSPPPAKPKEKLVLRGVHFDFNKSDIRPEDEPVLDEAVKILKDEPGVRLNVDGYCDAVGSDDYNQELSERRASAVQKYLENAGIASGRLAPRGFGKTHFVADNDTDQGRAQNRRVELIPIE